MAKGISASSVIIDGVKLNRYEEVFADGEVGYSVDHVNNTTTIWLPENWETIEITNGGGISRNLAFNSEIVSAGDSSGNKISNINDKDYTNFWTLPATNPEFEVVLDEVREISEIQLTWGFNYSNAYTIEISSDGYNYTEVADVTAGLGDEEVIKLDKTYEAQYIRFTGFEKAQKALSELTDIRIYGTEMDYVGICDITGNISAEKATEEDNFTDFEENNTSDTEETSKPGTTKKKKIIRKKFIPDSLEWWMILIIVVASVVVVGGVGVTVFILIRKKKATAKTG